MSLALASLDVHVELGADERLRAAARGVKSDLPCRTFDPDLWFGDSPAELELAKSLCAECPLRAECLAGAIERGEPWGVWGGEIFERGAVVPRKRPRGRPRKEDVARDAVLRVEVAARIAVVTPELAEASLGRAPGVTAVAAARVAA
jgi:WhiB family redox-sensing transcriptional regulator